MPEGKRVIWTAWSSGDGLYGCNMDVGKGDEVVSALAVQLVHLVSFCRKHGGMSPDDALDVVWSALKDKVQCHIAAGYLTAYRDRPTDLGDDE